MGFSIGQVQVLNLPELDKGVHRLQGISSGGIKLGIGHQRELTEKLKVSAALVLLYQQLELSYSLNNKKVFSQRIFPFTIEIPIHAHLDLVRPQNSVSALFGVKFSQSMASNSNPEFNLENNFWSFDIGLGKEFQAKRGTFHPAIIYSLGTRNLLRHSNVEILEESPNLLIYLHQISLQIQW